MGRSSALRRRARRPQSAKGEFVYSMLSCHIFDNSYLQTCKRGLALSKTHAYWSSAHRRLRKFLPPPLLDEAELSSTPAADLETRIIHAIRLDRAWKGLHGQTARRQAFGVATIASETFRTHGLRLLPGERWLLTHSHAGVRLWDLDSDSIDASMILIVPRTSGAPGSTVIQNGFNGWDIDFSEAPKVYRIALCSAVARQVMIQKQLDIHRYSPKA